LSVFVPVVLPEESASPHAAACQLCELSKQRKRVIWGEGNPQAPVILLLDNPGAREDKNDLPFVCGTRETLQKGAAEAGLYLSQVYVTYLLKCRPIRKYDKPLAREACEVHLEQQLDEKKPQILCCLGNTAVQSFFRSEEAEVKALRGRWHDVRGISTAVTYHPLAVRRRPVLMKYFVDDLKLVVDRLSQLDIKY
jgi:uracil-DNA glycosylase family 4